MSKMTKVKQAFGGAGLWWFRTDKSDVSCDTKYVKIQIKTRGWALGFADIIMLIPHYQKHYKSFTRPQSLEEDRCTHICNSKTTHINTECKWTAASDFRIMCMWKGNMTYLYLAQVFCRHCTTHCYYGSLYNRLRTTRIQGTEIVPFHWLLVMKNVSNI